MIQFENKPLIELDPPIPRCIAGKRASPPEDSGGIWAYTELLRVIADPTHPDHTEKLE